MGFVSKLAADRRGGRGTAARCAASKKLTTSTIGKPPTVATIVQIGWARRPAALRR